MSENDEIKTTDDVTVDGMPMTDENNDQKKEVEEGMEGAESTEAAA